MKSHPLSFPFKFVPVYNASGHNFADFIMRVKNGMFKLNRSIYGYTCSVYINILDKVNTSGLKEKQGFKFLPYKKITMYEAKQKRTAKRFWL